MEGQRHLDFQETVKVEARLLEQLANHTGFLIVEGPPGSGKSRLKYRLERRLAGHYQVIDLPYSRLTYEQLIAILGTTLKPEPTGLITPGRRARTEYSSTTPALLVIDDLHCMPDDTLESLCQQIAKHHDQAGALNVVAFAEAGYFDHRSDRFEQLLEPASVSRLRLPGPTEAEMETLIRSALQEELDPGTQPLEEAVLSLVGISGGNLHRAKLLVEHTVIEARLQGLTLIDATLIEEIAAHNDIDISIPRRAYPAGSNRAPPKTTASKHRRSWHALGLSGLIILGAGWGASSLPGTEVAYHRLQALWHDSPPEETSLHYPLPTSRQVVDTDRPLSILMEGPDTDSRTLADFVMSLLQRAREHEQAYRLTIPERDNAVIRYRQIQAVDPNNATAQQAIKRIEQIYLRRAQRAEHRKDSVQARHNYERLLWIDPDNRQARERLGALSDEEQTTPRSL